MMCGSGSGVRESSTRCTFGPSVPSSGLRGRDVHRRADLHERKKLRRSFPFESNTTMRPRNRMNVALMKSVSRGEFAPVTHRIADVASGSATGGRNDMVAIHTESVRTGALVLDLVVDGETTARGSVCRNSDGRARQPSGSDRLPSRKCFAARARPLLARPMDRAGDAP